MRPASLQKQTSAGGVIFKKNDNSFQIILISVRNGQAWCLPKGIVDKGETTEEAALREVSEETGLTGRIIDELGDINYWYYKKGHREAPVPLFGRMKKILERKGIQKISRRLRAEGRRIVFTNGCFDILH